MSPNGKYGELPDHTFEYEKGSESEEKRDVVLDIAPVRQPAILSHRPGVLSARSTYAVVNTEGQTPMGLSFPSERRAPTPAADLSGQIQLADDE